MVANPLPACITPDQAEELEHIAASKGNKDSGRARNLLDMLDSASEEAIRRLFVQWFPDLAHPPAPVGVLLSDVQPEKISWLWSGRLALGKLTILDGDPGLGKGFITLDLAARLSTGRQWPDGGLAPVANHHGGIVLITPEDGLADTIQPRLTKVGANLTKIVSIGTVPVYKADGSTLDYERPFTLPDDLPLLEQAVKRVDAKLLIIDPLMSVLGGDTNKDNEVRAMLTPIKMLAERERFAVLMVRHVTKTKGSNALYHGGGSIAFIGLSRFGLVVAEDPFDEKSRVLVNIKSNLAETAPSLSYQIVNDRDEDGDERGYVLWQGVSGVTAKDLSAHSTAQPSGGKRQEMLRIINDAAPGTLSPGDILKQLQERGIETDLNNVTVTLNRMKAAGEIGSPSRGLYSAAVPSQPKQGEEK